MHSTIRRLAALTLFLAAAAAHATPRIDLLPLDAVPLGVNPLQLATPQGALKIDLPGRSLTFATKTLSPQAGMTGVRGSSGEENRLQAFLWNGQILSADVYADDGRYQLMSFFGRDYWVRDSDLYRPLSLVDQNLDSTPAAAPAIALRAPAAQLGSGGWYGIDIHVLYTPRYQQRTGRTVAAIQAEAQRLIFVANTYFWNSGIPVSYRLVGLSAYAATNENVDCKANVEVMRNDGGLRATRNSRAADVVVLLRTSDGDISGGYGTAFNGMQQSYPPTNVNAERDGFACVHGAPAADGLDAQTYDVDHGFAHQVGHVLGGGHQYNGPKAVIGHYWRPFSHAWFCGTVMDGGPGPVNGPGLYFSIMAANDLFVSGYVLRNPPVGPDVAYDIGPLYGRPKGDFFSAPSHKRAGVQCGANIVQPPLGEALQADNARSITEAAPYVAAYR